jgi:hypothetical protein
VEGGSALTDFTIAQMRALKIYSRHDEKSKRALDLEKKHKKQHDPW